ncbi:MAG TPA: hypothetical protein VKR61_19010 [Bryobacteraceae bacterium]|nr:hypothetical protein [Bryobacteraceae bacterium]
MAKTTTARIFAVIFAAIVIAYFPALHGYFLHTDDFFFSCWGGFPSPAIFRFMAYVGRPLAGLIYGTHGLVCSMAGMNVLRGISVCILALLSLLVYRYLRGGVVSGLVALAAAIALVTTPPFATGVGYVATAAYVLAVPVAALAFAAASRGGIKFAVLAILLLIVSLALYQPGALFYIALAAVATFLCDPLTFWPEQIRKLAGHAAILAAACAVYYSVWRVWLRVRGAPLGAKYDGRQFGNIYEHLKWFVRTPLVEAANLWFVRPKLAYAILTGAVILAAMCLELRPGGGRRVVGVLGKLAAVAVMLPMTYGINLVSYMPSAEYRTYTALEGAILLLFMLALSRILPRRLAATAALAVAVCGICAANVTIRRYFTDPDSREFRFVKDRIEHYRQTQGDDFTMIVVVVRANPVAVVQRNEMGEPSLRHGPNLRPMVTAALRELGIARDVPVIQTLPGNPASPTWVEWATELHWMTLDYSYGPPRPGKVITIDASQIGSLR